MYIGFTYSYLRCYSQCYSSLIAVDLASCLLISVLLINPTVDCWISICRFTAEEKAKRDPFYFMPFGMGPRNCIGLRLALLEMKIAVAMLLSQYKIVTCDKTQVLQHGYFRKITLFILIAIFMRWKSFKIGR